MAEPTGSDRQRGSSMDSIHSRWVFQDDDDDDSNNDNDDDYEDLHPQDVIDSDEDDNGEMRLIRTGPSVDSFDVEALDVPGAHRNEYYEDVTVGRSILLAFQTLGVVFGDVRTSPLYAFSVMFSKAPVNGNEDVLGALSLVLYTLFLVPLAKHVLIVLLANDDGEGGTFALYSLICRHANASLLPNQLPSDARISSFRLKVPSPELKRSLKIKERLESSLTLKKLLLMLVLAGTSMVIADGIVTPTMSGYVYFSFVSDVCFWRVEDWSSWDQTRSRGDDISCFSYSFVQSLQRYGTSKVGLVIGPALFIWFCLLGGIGIYNLVIYDTSVLKAFNPVHLYYYFKRNSTKAWYSLGGCLLCATV